jgi:hypothetical protein
MHSKPTTATAAAQERAERERASRARLINASVDRVEAEQDRVFGRAAPAFPRDRFRDGFAGHYLRRPPRNASARTAAVHEGAHFVLFQLEGFGAWEAQIWGSKFGRFGYAGTARPFTLPGADAPAACRAADFIADARATLAGPIAEELLNDGDAAFNISEFWQARVVLARAAQLSGRKRADLWRDALIGAAVRVEYYQDEILAVADMLERRARITCWQPSIKRVLKAVDAKRFVAQPVSARGQLVIDTINSALREFGK